LAHRASSQSKFGHYALARFLTRTNEAPKIANFIKKMFGIAPTPDREGFIPSWLGLRLGVARMSDFSPTDFGGKKYSGDKRVLVLCTEERYFAMTDGTLFSTGQNVQETAVPLMHLVAAGFEFDVVTPTGAPAILEDWSVPRDDRAVIEFMKQTRAKFDQPLSLADMVAQGALDDSSPYVALFLPGGHGAMVGLPEDKNVGELIRWIHGSDRYLVAVCHGPAALLATQTKGEGAHPYAGYDICAFPDKIDRQSPSIGYLPGTMPWFQCEELEKVGINIINDGADGETHVDRKLFTGDSPKACDELGKMISRELLAQFG
jgi:molecular chaperone Hsp31 and glyoxalase 3